MADLIWRECTIVTCAMGCDIDEDLCPSHIFKPILRFELLADEEALRIAPSSTQPKFNTSVSDALDTERCVVSINDAILDSRGSRVTIHDCEHHWVIVKWVT